VRAEAHSQVAVGKELCIRPPVFSRETGMSRLEVDDLMDAVMPYRGPTRIKNLSLQLGIK
jgi:hypothetical protein